MSHVLARAAGGAVSLPDPATIMIDREDGGQLVVYPPRPVWDRTALSHAELLDWTRLVAATARAMLESLPQLAGGCLNYWDAGNWALNPAADPPGPKTGPAHRRLHLHLCGRSPNSADPSWPWGEAPTFPPFSDRFSWSLGKRALTAAECVAVVDRAREVLRDVYATGDTGGLEAGTCRGCGYPTPSVDLADTRCPTCRAEGGA
ncbi:MAG: hypothetical protein R2745_22910 [Vicinamibacterales bacterium]